MEPLRLTLLKKIKTIFEGVTDQGDPVPPNYGVKFSVVGIGALSAVNATKRYAIGIVVGDEKLPTTTGTRDPILSVDIEFRQTINQGDPEPGLAVEMLLAQVQQIIMDNETLDGEAISFQEVGNEIDITTYSDKTVRGVVRCELQYRQGIGAQAQRD